MKKYTIKYLVAFITVVLAVSISSPVYAQWPTLDIVAIKTAVTTNLELVKQSKIITDATAFAGKINAGIGDAKASISKNVAGKLEKAKKKAEKLKKEKERLEKKKAKYEKTKAWLKKKKQQIADAKAWAEEQKDKIAD